MSKNESTKENDFEKKIRNFEKEKNELDIDKELSKAIELMKDGKFKDAYMVVNKLALDFEKGLSCDNDEENEYYSFNNSLQLCLKQDENNDKKIKRNIYDSNTKRFSYGDIYYYLTYILLELNKFDIETEEAIKKAIRWNPVEVKYYLEYYEVVIRRNDIKLAEELVLKAFNYAYRKEDLALCYRKLGFCYTEKKEYETALDLYVYSRLYEKHPASTREINYIFSIVDRKLDLQPGLDKLKERFSSKNIPIGVNKNVLGIYRQVFLKL